MVIFFQVSGIVGLERGELQEIDPAILGLQSIRGQADAARSAARFETACQLVDRARAMKSRIWSSPRLANAVDLVGRLQPPRERPWVGVPRLLPGEQGQPELQGGQQVCRDSSVCYPALLCHYPFPVQATRQRPCPLGLGCLPTWEGVEMLLHLLEAHTLDCVELLCKYSILLPLILIHLSWSCDHFLDINPFVLEL